MESLAPIKKPLQNANAELIDTKDGVLVRALNKPIKSFNNETEHYTGFPTDMQAQFMALLCLAEGKAKITESIFENRFMHVAELTRMGAEIDIDGSQAVINGIKAFKPAEVMATDLRASVTLVLAALATKGVTTLNRVYHLDRGYEYLEEKLNNCGANISRANEK